MIIGGVSGAGKTDSMRSGFSSRFMPCRAFVNSPTVKAAFEGSGRAPIKYVASARIRNLTDTAWVDLPTVTYFQVTRRRGTGLDTATMTVKKPDTWGIYGTQAGLLRPSERQCQIYAGISVGGVEATIPLFFGRVTSYSEDHGNAGASINLQLADIRDRMDRTAASSYSGSQTAYRAALREAQDEGIWFLSPDQASAIASGTTTLNAILSTVLGVPALAVAGFGQLVVGEAAEDTAEGLTFSYTDDSVISLSRVLDNGASFNTATAQGLSGGTYTTQEVSDAADVVIRGNVRYAGGLIGSYYGQLTDAVATAQAAISRSLYGLVRCELQFNPFLEPGMSIGIQSTRIGLPASRLELDGIVQQYSVGSARTYINQAPVITL